MLDQLDALADPELKDLIAKSYEMVAAKAPKKGCKLRVRAARKKPRRKVGA
jgi:predicted DNA-binding protein (MmcQ/YjbR family)